MKYLNKNSVSIVLLFFTFLFADTDADLTVTSVNSIPFCASWATSGGSAPDWSDIDIDDYDIRFRKSAELPIDSDIVKNLTKLPVSQIDNSL